MLANKYKPLQLRNMLRQWVNDPSQIRHMLRDSQLGQAGFCIFLGLAVGAITKFIHHLIMMLHKSLFQLQKMEHLSSAADIASSRILLVPVAGGLAVGILSYLIKRLRPSEIVDPIEANAIRGGRMSIIDSLRLLGAAFISNSVGASVGMEAGYTQMGSGLLSWIGRHLQLRREDMRIFVAAGSAAAIAAAFNAPLAGAFYGFELILGIYTITALPQVALAALSASLYVRIFSKGEPIFSLSSVNINIPIWDYPFFLIVGVGAAILGITTMRAVTKSESWASQLSVPEWLRPALGGILLSLIALIFPEVLGSGQGAIDLHLHEHSPILILIGLLAAKMAGSAISIGLGFRGGLFSSSLFLGCLFGQICGIIGVFLLPQADGQMEGFILVGIGAVAASIVGAPITMILLVLEMTGNFAATTGVMVGVLVSSAITRYYFGYSFSTWRFHLRGIRIHSGQDIGWISDLTVDKFMRKDPKIVAATSTLLELRNSITPGTAKYVYVVDENENYAGMIDVTELHNPDLHKNTPNPTAINLAKAADRYLLPNQNIKIALENFATMEMEELPVLTATDNFKIIGYGSEAYALRRYTQELEARNLAQSIAGSPVV